MNPSLSQRDITVFFLPLVLWSLLIMGTHSVINATLAREADPTIVLAAYSVALAVYRTVNAWSISMQQIGLAFITDRRSIGRLALLGQELVCLNMLILGLLAFTVFGDWVYGNLFGASTAVVLQAKRASFWLAFILPVEMIRNLLAAILMQHRNTQVIFLATVARAIALVGAIALFRGVLDGVVLGSVAVGVGFSSEALVLAAVAWRIARNLPAAVGIPATQGEMARYGWPLAVNVLTENGIVLVVNLFIGRLARPDLALAAFGVVQALSLIFLTPLRNLSQTAQALTRTPADLRTMHRFTIAVSLFFCAVFLVLFYSPLREMVLIKVMGLPPELADYSAPATLIFIITPPLWAFSAVFRGVLARLRNTGVMATSGMVRLAVVAAVSAVTLLWSGANGAVVGMAALSMGFAGEAILLGIVLLRGRTDRGEL